MSEYPYIFDSDNKPKGFKGKRCRKIATNKRDKAQGLVMIEFQGHGTSYLVQVKKLVKPLI